MANKKEQIWFTIERGDLEELDRACETSEPPVRRAQMIAWAVKKFLEDRRETVTATTTTA